MIDFHMHFGNLEREGYPVHPPRTVEQAIDFMDRFRIDQGVLLPLESPEGGWGYLLTEEVIAARNRYPERFIAFFCVDPRYPAIEAFIDMCVQKHGCQGCGEHVNGLKFNDPLNKRIYAKCNEYGLPLDFGDDLGCYDEPGLPRLEECLNEFPRIKFCGHGPGFWSAISGDDDRTIAYPKTPIQPGGALDRLLARYDNLYLDLSAGSGYNAMTRDPEFTRGFIARHWRKMLWGIDYCVVNQPAPHVQWLATLDVAEDVRESIGDGNARTLLKLPPRSGS